MATDLSYCVTKHYCWPTILKLKHSVFWKHNHWLGGDGTDSTDYRIACRKCFGNPSSFKTCLSRYEPVSLAVLITRIVSMKNNIHLLLLVPFFFLPFDESFAQSRKGFEVGIGPGLLIASEDGESDSGFGAHLTLGYGIGERFTLGINGAAGTISDDEADDDIIASVGGIFGRLYFGAPEKLGRPYFTFGGGQGSLEAEFSGVKVEINGPSAMVGVGFDYMRAGSSLGFYGELNYNFVNFEEVSVGGITVDGLNMDVDYIVIAAGIRFRIQ